MNAINCFLLPIIIWPQGNPSGEAPTQKFSLNSDLILYSLNEEKLKYYANRQYNRFKQCLSGVVMCFYTCDLLPYDLLSFDLLSFSVCLVL